MPPQNNQQPTNTTQPSVSVDHQIPSPPHLPELPAGHAMSSKNLLWAGASALIVVAVLSGWYFAMMRGNNSLVVGTPGGVATTTTGGNTTAGNNTGSSAGAGTNVGVANERPDIPLPNLNRPYTPPANAPAEVQKYDRDRVAEAVFQLKIDPNHIAWWLELATYRKIGADYVGAEEVWLYVTKRWNTDPTSYLNLADLYQNYMNSTVKARAILEVGIKNVPDPAALQQALNNLPKA